MNINIAITCDNDLKDVKTFLSVIREQVINTIKTQQPFISEGETVQASDSNQFGNFDINITF